MASRQIRHRNRLESTTRPILLIIVVKDDTSILMKLVQLLVSLSMFLWLHKNTFLKLAENINLVFEAIKETYLYFEYQLAMLKNPIPYMA